MRLFSVVVLASCGPWFSAAGQGPQWEPTVMIARTAASARFDAQASSNGDRMGFAPSLGVSRRLPLGAIRVEAAIVQKGYERTQPTYHWTYFELPILFELRRTAGSAKVRPVAQVGLAPAVALSCTVSYVGVNGPYNGNCREPDPLGLFEPASMIDVGLVLGAGMRIRAGRQELLLEVRSNRGLMTYEKQSQQRVLSLGIGIAFPRDR